MSGIFGGSKSKSTSTSSNQAYPYLQGAYGSQVSTGTGANDFISQLLGLQGDAGANDAFDKYRDSAGYQFTLDSGSKAITGNAAARGMLNSGATAKALTKYGQDVASQYYNSYLDRLLGLSQQGLGAGGLIAGAGQQSSSQSTSKSKPGIGAFLGQVASGVAASDRRLKTNIIRIGRLANGLPMYTFRYTDGSGPYIGVLADEVKTIQPEALGPVVDGYATVDYDKLEGWENQHGV